MQSFTIGLPTCGTSSTLLGITEEAAARALTMTAPDPGAATLLDLDHPSGPWTLVNLFAANDPESTLRALEWITEAFGLPARPLFLFAARGDRTARSAEFAQALAQHRDRFSYLVIFGLRTRAMARKARRRGIPADRVLDVGHASADELMELLASRMEEHRVVVGMGNIIGPAQDWLAYLAERIRSEDPNLEMAR
jgi:hypothetical protein